MVRIRSWWGGAGRFVAACIVAMLVVGPGADALICKSEGVAVAAVLDEAGFAQDAHQDASAHGDRDVCVHGHCHHAAPYLAASAGSSATPAAHSQRFELPRSPVPASDPKFGLKRPPRG